MSFKSEKEFEDAIINLLINKSGWAGGVINYPTQKDLIKNWADILFKMNNEVDRLNGVALNDGEITKLLNEINKLQTPNQRNNFINGKTITIKRENEKDTFHYGKEISLKIFDRNEIAAGSSIYQIARQPRFDKTDPVGRNRRGDFMLLINGLPVIHVELKNSGVPINQAIYQIKSYLHENKFSGLFSLIQIFVAMTPEDMRYFANPGESENFNPDYHFYWADFNNELTNDWKTVASNFLSIPMAHQLIGYYTIADKTDGILKVMRSYQIYATKEIVDRVREKQKDKWSIKDQLGGYIWHTTGSGKTMTSFKSAELIAQLKYCDKVVFLVDRISLANQTFLEFEGFSNDEAISDTDDTGALMKILTDDQTSRLVVTSIKKMSNLIDGKADERKLKQIKNKRVVFIVDEAHRSTLKDMMRNIKNTYKDAIFFGFTGTPIQTKTNKSTEITTADIFGNELHRYTLADGIRDKNVLGFDVTKVDIFSRLELRKKYALYQANVRSTDELANNDNAYKTYEEYMDKDKHSDVEIDEELGNTPYENDEYKQKVVQNILESWVELNHNNEFSAIFATSSIKDAIKYWRLLKDNKKGLKITCIFDASDDKHNEFSIEKNDGLVDILNHYNKMYKKSFSISTHDNFKVDVAKRLAQKDTYRGLSKNRRDEKIDIVIVVHQLLTGYDSKWVSILYLDRKLEMHNLIQAFSRTNRLNGDKKPHGTIRYYRKTATMECNILEAVKEYSGDKPNMMFVDKLPANIRNMNKQFDEIVSIFNINKIENFSKLPEDVSDIKKFIQCFNTLYRCYNAAITQGFNWGIYYDRENNEAVKTNFTKEEFYILLQRYREIEIGGGGSDNTKINLDINYNITEENSKIDYEFINSNFNKYIKALFDPNSNKEDLENLKISLHKNFASLPRDRQVIAEMIINDLENGELKIAQGWDFNDYINEYSATKLDKQIDKLINFCGVNKEKLKELLNYKLTEDDINEYGRFDLLLSTIDYDLVIKNLSKLKNQEIPIFKAKIYLDKMLRKFILENPFDIEEYNAVHLSEI